MQPKNKTLLTIGIFLGILVLINVILLATGSTKLDWSGFGIMVGAGFTIALFSFLYHDNPIFKIAEHFYIGVSAAYLLVIQWYNVLLPDICYKLKDLLHEPMTASVMKSILFLALPTMLGLLLYTRFSKKTEWMGRISFAFLMGFGAGVSIPNNIDAQILQQLKPTLEPLWTSQTGFLSSYTFGHVVIFLGVLSTLIYFFFSLEHKGVVGGFSRMGVWFLMIAFGASFGYTVMARISLLIGRVTYVFGDWIPLIR